MSTADWDVVVLGAGPAGSVAAVAALAVDPGLRVLLLDRADFPRDKCCGDGIAAQAVEVLEGLGLADAVADWTPLRRLDLSLGETNVTGRMARDVYVVPRQVFDARLVRQAVDRGAVLRRHRAVRVDIGSGPAPRGWARSAGPARPAAVDDVRATTLVGADGAHSRARAAVASRHDLRSPRRALALRGYAPTTPERRGLQVIRYGSRRQPSYAWAFDRGDGLSNVGYGELVDGADAAPSRAGLLAELETLLPGTVEGGTDWRGHHLPLSGFGWAHPAGRCLLAGDAAGLVNPMTGEGIYYAVATGALAGRTAAEAVLEGRPELAGARYRRAVRDLLGTHLRHTWAAGGLSRSPRVVAAGIRTAATDQAVFDDLVEIGLGGGRITPRLGLGLVAQLAHSPAAPSADPSRPAA